MQYRFCELTGNIIGEDEQFNRIVYAPMKSGGFRFVDANISGKTLAKAALALARWYRSQKGG